MWAECDERVRHEHGFGSIFLYRPMIWCASDRLQTNVALEFALIANQHREPEVKDIGPSLTINSFIHSLSTWAKFSCPTLPLSWCCCKCKCKCEREREWEWEWDILLIEQRSHTNEFGDGLNCKQLQHEPPTRSIVNNDNNKAFVYIVNEKKLWESSKVSDVSRAGSKENSVSRDVGCGR